MKTKMRCKVCSLVLAFAMLLSCGIMAFAAEEPEIETYAVNSNGETYGNNLQAQSIGVESDLILAVGDNGVTGYVRSSDLNEDVSTPEDALLHTESSGRYIPLYESDGETVIGQFYVGNRFTAPNVMRSSYTYGNTGVMSPPSYTGYSTSAVRGCTNGVNGKTSVSTSKQVAAGWIGVQVFVYKQSTGALVASSDWVYNGSAASYFEKEIYHFSITGEAYYCQGQARMWNSEISSYWTYSTYASPAANAGS